jgi:nicotinate-nucleotide adenylyltransferase
MGSDNLENFHHWRNWQEIAARLPLAVVQRPGSLRAASHAAPVRRFGKTSGLKAPPAIIVLDGARNPESATRLRSIFRKSVERFSVENATKSESPA